MIGNPFVVPGAAAGNRSNVSVMGMTTTPDDDDFPHSVPTQHCVSLAVSVSLYTPGAFVASTSLGELVGAAAVPSFTQRSVWLEASPVFGTLFTVSHAMYWIVSDSP